MVHQYYYMSVPTGQQHSDIDTTPSETSPTIPNQEKSASWKDWGGLALYLLGFSAFIVGGVFLVAWLYSKYPDAVGTTTPGLGSYGNNDGEMGSQAFMPIHATEPYEGDFNTEAFMIAFGCIAAVFLVVGAWAAHKSHSTQQGYRPSSPGEQQMGVMNLVNSASPSPQK